MQGIVTMRNMSKAFPQHQQICRQRQLVLEAKATQLFREKSGLQDQVEGALYEHSRDMTVTSDSDL